MKSCGSFIGGNKSGWRKQPASPQRVEIWMILSLRMYLCIGNYETKYWLRVKDLYDENKETNIYEGRRKVCEKRRELVHMGPVIRVDRWLPAHKYYLVFTGVNSSDVSFCANLRKCSARILFKASGMLWGKPINTVYSDENSMNI